MAWPRQCESLLLDVPDGTTVADAVAHSGMSLQGVAAYAIHGMRAETAQVLRDGDRIELLRPLQADPTEMRRRRAAQRQR